MIELRTKQEIEGLRKAGQLVAACHKAIAPMIVPGATTMEVERTVERLLKDAGARAFTKGYKGYQYATCASVNDVIAHGFPNERPLKEGDIVKIDIVAEYEGWLGDSCWCYSVGDISERARRLMQVTKECLYIGIQHAQPGNRIGDFTSAIQQHAEKNGYSIVRDLTAHGVGRKLHEEPNIVHVGTPGRGLRLKEGMVFTIEPMVNEGDWLMKIDDDGWTARTLDGLLSAQYEHTIAITEDGPLILTDQGE